VQKVYHNVKELWVFRDLSNRVFKICF
jgi:hypothetical protein